MSEDNATRYAQFCQFRRQIRGSSDYVIVGIDVAKDRHHAFFGTANARTLLKRLVFDNNQAGFEKLLERTRQLREQNDFARSVFALEPTGNYHKSLAHWLLDQGQLLV